MSRWQESGAFIPHPDTPLASYPGRDVTMNSESPGKLPRLALPHANFACHNRPSSTLQKDGRPGWLCPVVVNVDKSAQYNPAAEVQENCYENSTPDSASLKDPEDGGIGEIAGMLKAVGRGVSSRLEGGHTLPREKRPIPARE